MQQQLIEQCSPIYAYALFNSERLKTQDINTKDVFDTIVKMCDNILNSNSKDKRSEFAIFAICAYIDEKFLTSSNQTFSSSWKKNTLQKYFFKTNNAGTIFFEKLNLIKNDKELLQIYEYAIALGFNGTYYENDNKEKIENIKHDILENNKHGKTFHLFDKAYINDLSIKQKSKLLITPVNFAMVLFPLVFLAITYIILSSDLSTEYNLALKALK